MVESWTGPGELVGREADLALVTGLLEAVGDRGCAHVITGEAGIGKTSLLAAAGAEARRRGMTVLTTRGAESERHLPYAALHDLLRQVLPQADTLPARHREALLGAFGMSVSEQAPERFFVALAALELIAEAASARPLLMVVDDMQWVDAASRDTIEFLARRLESEPAVLLVARRPVPADEDGTSGDPAVGHSVLRGLDPEASRTLLVLRAPSLSPAVERRVLDEAQGNPLALLELPVALKQGQAAFDVLPLTARLERAFAARLAGVDAATRRLLLLAAVNDGDRVTDLVAAAKILSGPAAAPDGILPDIAPDLLKIDGPRTEFRHPLVRSAIWHSASARERRAAHQALAEALVADPDRRAWHLAAATTGIDEQVAAALDAAADRALERGAPSSAEAWLERAAELSADDGHRGGRLLRAAEIAFERGRSDSVQQLIDRARALRLDASAQARLNWLDSAFDDGTPGDAAGIRRLVGSADRARTDGEFDLAADLLVGAAIRCWWAEPGPGIRAELMATADSLTGGLSHGDADPRLLAAWAVGGRFTRHRHVVDRLNWWAERGDVDPAATGLLARAAFVCGEFARALHFTRPARDGLRLEGRLGLLAQVLVLETFAAMYLGRWDLTAPAADEAERLAVETRQPVWEACALLGRANLAGLRGETEAAETSLAKAERVALMTGNEAVINGAQLSHGLIELGRQRPETAFHQLRRMMDEGDHAYHPVQQAWAIDYLAEAAAASGHLAEARTVLTRLEQILESTPADGVMRAIRYARVALSDDGDAEHLFKDAYDLSAAASPWYRARLDLAHGAWLRRGRRTAEARGPLRSAQSAFDTLGAAAWSARAARELRASGLKTERAAAQGTPRLSAQEWQIARLAAQGLSNRDIAQQLYLSHRTISSHLYNIFPKLGITSRAQLRGALPTGADDQ
ncbi:AAA family ATPase [Streptomyces sp. NPDC048277]|uniref:helix-turn-helix transcriptional regulator n=1 Tax=Streptomyces sp. NPDC048277 TaxID=3155027 RepID=UPI0033CCC710